MARAGETEERIAGADLSGEGSPASRMEGKWEKDTAGTGRDTRVLCPSSVPFPAFPPGWAGAMGRVRANSQHSRAPGGICRGLPQMHPLGQLWSWPPATRDALGHPRVPGAGSQETALIW